MELTIRPRVWTGLRPAGRRPGHNDVDEDRGSAPQHRMRRNARGVRRVEIGACPVAFEHYFPCDTHPTQNHSITMRVTCGLLDSPAGWRGNARPSRPLACSVSASFRVLEPRNLFWAHQQLD